MKGLLLILICIILRSNTYAQYLTGTWKAVGMEIQNQVGNWTSFDETSLTEFTFSWVNGEWSCDLILEEGVNSSFYLGNYRELSYSSHRDSLADHAYFEVIDPFFDGEESYLIEFNWCKIGVDCNQFSLERIDHDIQFPRYRYVYERIK
ncbi:MAG: hypothetical protein ACQEW9_02280 [Bacteroidota bacterium]